LYSRLEGFMRHMVYSLSDPSDVAYYGAIGPIIRITPDEVHVNDPQLIDVVYPGGGGRVNKDPYFMRQFG
jgi:hypothetical protein